MKKGILLTLLLFCGCDAEQLNNPYPPKAVQKNTYFTSFSERPKHLDPARSYSSNEWAITNLIYEPPYQYHYLKRPYELEPLTASQMPKVKRQKNGSTAYTINIRSDLYTQPHPAFCQNMQGEYLYHHIEDLEDIESPLGFTEQCSRKINAGDFVRAIKRLADPTVQSPIFGLMSEYIQGLGELRAEMMQNPGKGIDEYSFSGAYPNSDTSYTILVKDYPQFKYWLAMPFFAPIPEEVLSFYNQPVLRDVNISLDWWPVGTGPYYMTYNNPSHKIVLSKNPNYRLDVFPEETGNEFSEYAGEPIPIVDEIYMTLEKESIPRWQKFQQGYYDMSGVSSDSFDQAISLDQGSANLSDQMQEKGISLHVDDKPSIFYWGFNLLDPVVGQANPNGKFLRQAISIAIDVEEYISIFLNGRGTVANGPIPPGIFGYEPTPNLVTHTVDGKRRTINDAEDLLEKAGYKGGIDPKTGKPLIIYYDTVGGGTPEARSQFAWMTKQFSKIGLQLIVRDTQYNRFQDKMKNGSAQFFGWGWNADYPDPENFLFLLVSTNAKARFEGENAANYQSGQFDRLHAKIAQLEDGAERTRRIHEIVELLQNDAPWVWGYYPTDYVLKHTWVGAYKPHSMSRNTIKYLKIDPKKRMVLQKQWNKANVTVMSMVGLIVSMVGLLSFLIYLRRQRRKPKRNLINA